MAMINHSELLYTREVSLDTREASLDVAKFRQVLMEPGLGTTCPVDDMPRLAQMLTAVDVHQNDDPFRPNDFYQSSLACHTRSPPRDLIPGFIIIDDNPMDLARLELTE